jgi:hypothetical protein
LGGEAKARVVERISGVIRTGGTLITLYIWAFLPLPFNLSMDSTHTLHPLLCTCRSKVLSLVGQIQVICNIRSLRIGQGNRMDMVTGHEVHLRGSGRRMPYHNLMISLQKILTNNQR